MTWIQYLILTDPPPKNKKPPSKIFRENAKEIINQVKYKTKKQPISKAETVFYESLANYMNDKENEGFLLKLNPVEIKQKRKTETSLALSGMNWLYAEKYQTSKLFENYTL